MSPAETAELSPCSPGSASFYTFRTRAWGGEPKTPYFVAGYRLDPCQPRTSVRGTGFQTRENALSCNDRALALVRMLQAPQSTRTFFVTSTTAGRRALLQSDRMAQLLVAPGLKSGADGESSKRRFLLHEFVIMPQSFPSAARTPAAEIPLEKALQFIKGGFSYRAKREIHFAFENMASQVS